MTEKKGQQLYQLGQAIWYDNIQRKLINSGALKQMINEGAIYGVTSNPSIFNQAISKTSDYDAEISNLAWAGLDATRIFWNLAVSDIQRAADLFLPLYEETKKRDGYVSLEVDPVLARNALGTLKAAMKLWQRVDRPNLMIKIPATIQGLVAIRRLISYGVNINVTLIFSLIRYAEVIDAYVTGLTDRISKHEDIANIHSVASFFVSRVDTKVDNLLLKMVANGKLTEAEAGKYYGKAAIANAKKAYDIYQKSLTTKRFSDVERFGVNKQRPLWASTSTKNPQYNDLMYVENLIGVDTVNTIPPQTLDSFLGRGKIDLTLSEGVEEADATLAHLRKIGISMMDVTDELEKEGVKAFKDAYFELLSSIDIRRIQAVGHHPGTVKKIRARLHQLGQQNLTKRIKEGDGSIWVTGRNARDGVKHRMGWVDLPAKSLSLVDDLEGFAKKCWQDGFRQAILLGMGGSSLAAEVFAQTFPSPGIKNRMDVRVLDSTDPEQIKSMEKFCSSKQTLLIASSKSGETAEVNALLEYFWQHQTKKWGRQAKDRFVVITDPGTPLERTANHRKFLRCFLSDPDVGGRFSALSVFGLLPAALMGIDLNRILESAKAARSRIEQGTPLEENHGFIFGVWLAENAKAGRDKLTIISDPLTSSLGSWVEQLVAESTGKDGKGIVPIDQEPELAVTAYSKDRAFVYHRLNGSMDGRADLIRKNGFPVFTIDIHESYELAGAMYLWEYATAVACRVLGVNPFDQPDVQASKRLTQEKIDVYKRDGILIEQVTHMKLDELEVRLANVEMDINKEFDLISAIKNNTKNGDYIGIMAYLPRNEKNLLSLRTLRESITDRTTLPATMGFGPRYLHSTGQLHKGGPNNGLFILITGDSSARVLYPPDDIPFAVLKQAQALGDYEALAEKGRRVIQFHLSRTSLNHLVERLIK